MSDDPKRTKVYSISIAALFALLAFMLVIVSMNMFGHRDKALKEQPSLPHQPPESLATSSTSTTKPTPTIEESTAGSACSLSDRVLRDVDLQELANNQNLRTLTLSHCSFSGQSSAKLSVKTVHVSNSTLDANAIAFIAHSPSIKCAEFFSCTFQPLSLHALRSSKIAWLQIRNSKVLTTDNSFSAGDISDISSMPQLIHLELERSQIAANVLGGINKSNVQVVNLRDCDLNDTDLAKISTSPQLKYINILSNPKLSVAGVVKLLRAPKIQHIKCDLDFSNTALSHLDRIKVDAASYHVPASFYEK